MPGKVTYKDNAGVCYKYRSEEVTCPKDKSVIKELPLQYKDDKKESLVDNIKKNI